MYLDFSDARAAQLLAQLHACARGIAWPSCLAVGAGLARGSSPTRATAEGRLWTPPDAAGEPPSPPGGADGGGGGGKVTNPHSRTAAARGLSINQSTFYCSYRNKI